MRNANALPAGLVNGASLTIGTAPKYGRGAGTARSVFCCEPGLVSSHSKPAVVILDFWRVWGVHVPRIWIRSIDPGEITVKQK
jgi:hypothetical protein